MPRWTAADRSSRRSTDVGFKDANWAYTLDLLPAQKAVLAAIGHATDDKTHQTYVSQKTIAAMVGMSVATVNRSVGALEAGGVLSRQRRSGAGGYRTTDIITVNTTYVAETNVAETNVGDTYIGETSNLHDSDAPPTSPSAIAEEINQIDQPEDQPDLVAPLPPKPKKPVNGTRLTEDWQPTPWEFTKARRHGFDGIDLTEETKRFIDYWIAIPGARGRKLDWDATWRNWIRRAQDDAGRRNKGKASPTDRARQTAAAGQRVAGRVGNVTTLNPPKALS